MRIVIALVALVLAIVGIVLYLDTRRAPSPAAALAERAPAMPDATRAVVPAVPAVPAASAPAPLPPGAAADAAFVPAPLEALRNSGTATEVWVPDATRLVHAIAPDAAVECYVAGCGAVLGFSSEAAYQVAIHAVADDRTWTGGKRWTDAARGGGRITVALILYRPD